MYSPFTIDCATCETQRSNVLFSRNRKLSRLVDFLSFGSYIEEHYNHRSAEMASSSDMMEAVQEWMFNDDFAQRMEQFALTNCDVFEYIADRSEFDDAENKLEYTNLYKTFQETFETEFEQFLTSKGWTLEQFVAACRAEGSKGDDGNQMHGFILAMTEFNVFKSMMLDTKKGKVESSE
jgi:hypothetical protein